MQNNEAQHLRVYEMNGEGQAIEMAKGNVVEVVCKKHIVRKVHNIHVINLKQQGNGSYYLDLKVDIKHLDYVNNGVAYCYVDLVIDYESVMGEKQKQADY